MKGAKVRVGSDKHILENSKCSTVTKARHVSCYVGPWGSGLERAPRWVVGLVVSEGSAAFQGMV